MTNKKMMDDKFKKGIKDIRNLGMNKTEKDIMLSKLEAYTNERPATIRPNFWQENFRWYSFVHSSRMAYTAFLLIFTVTGSSLLVASQDSLPGDLLYSVKVNVAEKAVGVTIFDPIAKVNWEAEKVERRLQEIEILAVQGGLNTKLSESIQVKLEEQTQSFYETVAITESLGNSQSTNSLRLDFEAKVETHGRILEKIEKTSKSEQKEEISKFRNSIMANQNDTISISATTMMVEEPALPDLNNEDFEKKEVMVLDLINSIEQTLNEKNSEDQNVENELQKEILSDTLEDLNKAKATLKEARKKKDEGNIREASAVLRDSRRNAKNADTLLKQGIKLGEENAKINVGRNGEIEIGL